MTIRKYFVMLCLVALTSSAFAQSSKPKPADERAAKGTEQMAVPTGQPVLWRDPGAIETLDLVGGAAGRAGAPKPPFTFIEESMSGSNPKVKIVDANKVQWTMKFGSEVNAEVFASRLAWAVGYFVEP